jgi:hypothetical protein
MADTGLLHESDGLFGGVKHLLVSGHEVVPLVLPALLDQSVHGDHLVDVLLDG